nr:DUF551 domain-containing protein [Serratia marcescens]
MLSLEKCKGGDPRRQILLFTHPAPEAELKAVVERLNASGYEYEDGPVTTRNASAVVDILLQQLDDAVQERDTPPSPAVAEEIIPGGLVYSSALPEFESNDSDKVIGYHCFISGQTRSVEGQEQAYADAKTVINAFRATVLQNCASDEPSIDAGLTANKCENCASFNQPVSQGYALPESWISRDERMPKDGNVVLVFEEGGIIFCAEVDNGEFYPDEFPLVPTRGKEITHWMPLPTPPEVRRDDA